MKKLFIALTITFLSLSAFNGIAADDDAAMAARINQLLQSVRGNPYDVLKDAGRKPVETSQFFGIKAGMTVLEMTAGSGYNAEILSAAVGPDGVVYAHNYHSVLRLIKGAHHQAMLARLQNHRLPNVRYMIVDAEDMPFDSDIDMAFWGFNLHDIYNESGEEAALVFLTGIERALKPGGVLAISDHVGEAGNDNAELHRIEPEIMMDLLKKAGFTIEATSDLLANPKDDHTRSIYGDDLRYMTDRILIRARKPH